MFKKVMPLSLILAFRFFGLFLVFPVLSIYVLSMPGSSPLLAGIAVGGFALTQVMLQVPFGLLSDRVGRKQTIFLGLIIFIAGSFVCAMADTVEMLIIGRLLQGAGAFGGVISATISDVVSEEKRPKAMAMMGGTISMSFVLAMMLAPLIAGEYGTDKLFLIAAFFAFLSMILLFTVVPESPKIEHAFEEMESKWHEVLKDPNLVRMNISNFLQKGFMALTFLILPIALSKDFGWEKAELYQVYVPATLVGMFAIPIAVIFAQKKGKYRGVLGGGIAFFALAYLLYASSDSTLFLIGVFCFFIGFSLHEPILQALASKYAKAHQRGAALGVFNSFGFLGTFIGGVFGGFLLQYFGQSVLSGVVILIALVWIAFVLKMPNPANQKNLYIPFDTLLPEWKEAILKCDGILEYYVNKTEGTLIVKYDHTLVSAEAISGHVKEA